MANNRFYLVCLHCLNQEATTVEQCVFFLAKYYPSEGWYLRGGDHPDGPAFITGATDRWFAEHKHGGMFGDYVVGVTEAAIGDGFTQEKREIMAKVQEALAK